MFKELRRFSSTAAAVAFLAVGSPAPAETDPVLAELDAFWAGIARAASAGDFDAMASTYHEDAVLVSQARGKSVPIAEALAGWKPGMDETKSGAMSASVEFRFTDRLNDRNTAHQTGIFRYEESRPGSEPSVVYIHFEALLIRQDGWKVLMEYQKHPATEQEWAAAGQ